MIFRRALRNGAFLLILLFFTGCTDFTKLESERGVLDASQWDFNKNGITNLDGQWEFYWSQLIEPNGFAEMTPSAYINLPNVWNNLVIDGESLDGDGYATMRLKVVTSGNVKRMGLRVPFHFTSYKLWINDNLMAENGVVAKDRINTLPQTVPNYVYFDLPSKEFYIVLQVANFTFNKGGAPAPYKLGSELNIRKFRTRSIAFDLFLTGSLFIMALYHFSFFLLRKKEISTLFFSLLCFLFVLRTIGLGESFLIEVFPNFNFENYIRLIFVGFFFGPVLFILFIQKLFPDEAKPIIGKIYIFLGIVFGLSLLFPSNVSTVAIIPYQLVVLTSQIYLIYILIRAMIMKREGALIAFIGTFVFIGTASNDILFDNQIINTDYYSPYGLFFFIFCQSVLLSFKFSKSFASIENLSLRIQAINKANSRFVPSQFLSFLGKDSIVDVKLGDNVTKEMTIFFADIRSFTTISEGLTPEENFDFINNLLKRFSPMVRQNNGFIDKFMGDAIMALFPDDPKDALLTASEVLEELRNYNKMRAIEGLKPIKLGIGINTGTLMLGTIGEDERMDGTVISDSVNLASRLEGLTKTFGSNIIISENVLNRVKNEIEIQYRFLGIVFVKGKSISVTIYDIFSYDAPEIIAKKRQIKKDFEEGVRYFEEQKYDEARFSFEGCLKIYPEDKATKHYIGRIETDLRLIGTGL